MKLDAYARGFRCGLSVSTGAKLALRWFGHVNSGQSRTDVVTLSHTDSPPMRSSPPPPSLIHHDDWLLKDRGGPSRARVRAAEVIEAAAPEALEPAVPAGVIDLYKIHSDDPLLVATCVDETSPSPLRSFSLCTSLSS